MEKKLHIVSFDIPYPPNYGGIIDVFYKIKELSNVGIAIYLHCYSQKDSKKHIELEKICKKVMYYDRNNFFSSAISSLPFRVKSRSDKALLENLKINKAPILFEGLQSAYALSKENLSNTFVRTHNIEHTYFFGLSKSEKNIFKKVFFYIEALKLKNFEKILKKTTGIFTISPFEQNYFLETYGEKSVYIPVFFDATENQLLNEKSDKFVLYHGDLRVSDNIKAALFLIETYKNTPFNLVIASSCKHKEILSKCQKYQNISFEDIPTQQDLEMLLSRAHVNTLFTFQKTGIKLKLLNTLFKGKHIIANSMMIEDTGLENLCELANSKKEILTKTKMLYKKDFSIEDFENRKEKLTFFNPKNAAKKIVSIIFDN